MSMSPVFRMMSVLPRSMASYLKRAVGKRVGADVVTPGGGDETVSWHDDYGACDLRTVPAVHTAEVHTAVAAERARRVRRKRGSTSLIVQGHQVQVEIEFHPFYITYGDVVPTGKQQRLVY